MIYRHRGYEIDLMEKGNGQWAALIEPVTERGGRYILNCHLPTRERSPHKSADTIEMWVEAQTMSEAQRKINLSL